MNETRYYCPICRKKVLKLPLAYREDGEIKLSGEWAFHAYDTHGIPAEVLARAFQQECRRVIALL